MRDRGAGHPTEWGSKSVFPIEKDMFTSCEFIYQLFLHVSPSDVTCKGVFGFINWSSCLRAACIYFFLLGITDLWAVFCRFAWYLVFWWHIRETWVILRGFSLVVDLIILVCLTVKEIAHWSLSLQCNCWPPAYRAVLTYLNPHVVMLHGACGWLYQIITHYSVVSILISMLCPCGSRNEWCRSKFANYNNSCNFCGHSRSGHGGCICSVWSCNCIDVYLFMWKDLGNIIPEIVWFIFLRC